MAEVQGSLIKIGESKAGIFQLYENKLINVLRSPSASNRKLMIISVCGEPTFSKCIILNVLFNYLERKANEAAGVPLHDWFNVTDSPLQFPLQNIGSGESCIFMWDMPFLLNLPELGEFAVIIVDVQGFMKSPQDFESLKSAFAFSSIISSIQIVNFNNIAVNDLELFWQLVDFSTKLEGINLPSKLQFVTERSVVSRNENSILANLWDMVMSKWPFGSCSESGFIEGKEVLNRLYKMAEQMNIHELAFIKTSYQDISCFKIPFDGTVSSSNFDGSLSELQDAFKKDVRVFVEYIFQNSNVTFKKVNGQVADGFEVATYIKKVCDANDLKPSKKSVGAQEGDSRKKNLIASDGCLKTFLSKVDEYSAKNNPDKTLEYVRKEKEAVLHEFENKVESGTAGYKKSKRHLLENIRRVEHKQLVMARAQMRKSGVPALAIIIFLVLLSLSMMLYILYERFGIPFLFWCFIGFGIPAGFQLIINIILFFYITERLCVTPGGNLFMIFEGIIDFYTSPKKAVLGLLSSYFKKRYLAF